MASLSSHLPPTELWRWTWPSVSFGQEKKSIIERGWPLHHPVLLSWCFYSISLDQPLPFSKPQWFPSSSQPVLSGDLVVSLYFHRHLLCCAHPLKPCELLAEGQVISIGPLAKLGGTGCPSCLGTHAVPWRWLFSFAPRRAAEVVLQGTCTTRAFVL